MSDKDMQDFKDLLEDLKNMTEELKETGKLSCIGR